MDSPSDAGSVLGGLLCRLISGRLSLAGLAGLAGLSLSGVLLGGASWKDQDGELAGSSFGAMDGEGGAKEGLLWEAEVGVGRSWKRS